MNEKLQGPRTIVVSGKGGVGKTTVSAIISRHLASVPQHRALLVDADHASGLGLALGISADKTLRDVRVEALEDLESRRASRKDDFNQSVEFRLHSVLCERDNLVFLALGRPEEKGCFCAVNTVLKRTLTLLASQFDTTLIDAEAGVEQINRDVVGDVDFLLLVADTSVKALRVAESIREVAVGLGRAKNVGLLLNRVRDVDAFEAASQRTDLPILGWIPEDPQVAQFDAEARPFFELPDGPATAAAAHALAHLLP